jgi:hypothetical protein
MAAEAVKGEGMAVEAAEGERPAVEAVEGGSMALKAEGFKREGTGEGGAAAEAAEEGGKWGKMLRKAPPSACHASKNRFRLAECSAECSAMIIVD